MRILKIVAHVLPRERDVNANGKGGWFSWFFQRRRKAGLEGRSLRETRDASRDSFATKRHGKIVDYVENGGNLQGDRARKCDKSRG